MKFSSNIAYNFLKPTIWTVNKLPLDWNKVTNEANRHKERTESTSSSISTDSEDKQKIHHALPLNSSTNLKDLKLLATISSKNISSEQIANIILYYLNSFSSLFVGKTTNYQISELIKKASKQQKIEIFNEIGSDIENIAMNEYGSHPLQVLIEKASSKEEVRLIINYLTKCKDFVALCKSQQGSFVIQKIISYFHEKYRNQLNRLILENILILSTDMNGVLIVNKYINSCENKETLSFLTSLFCKNIIFLSVNKYSNYAIQTLMKKVRSFGNLLSSFYQSIDKNFMPIYGDQYGIHVINTFSYISLDFKRKHLSND